LVSVQKRIAGRLRHRGMGGGAALFEWESRDVWRVVRRSDAISGGDCEATAPGRDLSNRDGVELSRRVDLSGRRVRAVVQRVVVRHFSRRNAAELCAAKKGGRHGSGAKRAKIGGHRRRTRGRRKKNWRGRLWRKAGGGWGRQDATVVRLAAEGRGQRR